VETVAPEKVPHLGIPSGTTGILEVDAGVLSTERVFRAATAWLAAHPLVTLRPAEPEAGTPARHTMVLRPPSSLVARWTNAPAACGLGTDGHGWVVPSGDGSLVRIGSDAILGADGWRLLAGRILTDMDRYTVVATRSWPGVPDRAAPLVAGHAVAAMR